MTTSTVNITASGDDGRVSGGNWSTTSENHNVGSGAATQREACWLFAGFPALGNQILQSVLFNCATRAGATGSGSLDVDWSVNDVESPTMPTSVATFDAKARTTAVTQMTSYTHVSDGDWMGGSFAAGAIDLEPSVQEVLDAGHDPTDFLVFADDGNGEDRYARLRSTDRAGAEDPRMVIDHIDAETGEPPYMDAPAVQRRLVVLSY